VSTLHWSTFVLFDSQSVAPPFGVIQQYLLPKQALTSLAGRFAAARAGGATTAAIRWFVARYGVAMHEAAEPDPAAYATFNEFFTRPLKAGVRPLADAALVCPVDGAVSQCGPIADGQIVQAKGHTYSTTTLVGGDAALAEAFSSGAFSTLYLSPKDYHRIHMPCDGDLTRMIYVPGDLFSVNALTAQHVPGLFARNERVVCVFTGKHGPFVMVLVGATIVGSMATVWHGVVNPPRAKSVREWHYERGAVSLRQGDEMGRFLLGSTVALLLPPGGPRVAAWASGRPVRMGEAMSV